jgi:hypothetical protein
LLALHSRPSCTFIILCKTLLRKCRALLQEYRARSSLPSIYGVATIGRLPKHIEISFAKESYILQKRPPPIPACLPPSLFLSLSLLLSLSLSLSAPHCPFPPLSALFYVFVSLSPPPRHRPPTLPLTLPPARDCGVAIFCRLLKMLGLVCKRAPVCVGSFANETCIFREPTNRCHFIVMYGVVTLCRLQTFLKNKNRENLLQRSRRIRLTIPSML